MSDNVREWIGRGETRYDELRVQPARFMQATLGREATLEEGSLLPPLWHWLYFLEARPQGELGRDGHPRKGGFLPPVALPRRMWAGGRLEFHCPLPLGAKVRKKSSIKDIVEKEGRTGALCFVTVLHELFLGDAPAISEEHDIVYREDPSPGAPKPTPEAAPERPEVSEEITPSQVMLFRYSALTFNGHRIHYDVDYAREVEGYDGLVFHGPFTATLLIDLACRTFGKAPASFSFRALAPITGMDPFRIEGCRGGDQIELWARRRDGAAAMTATARF